MGKFFIEPYIKYNEELKKATNINIDGTKVLASTKNICEKIKDISLLLSNLDIKEQDLENKIKMTIDNTFIFQSNIENVLKMAVREAINSLLPETEMLKDEDINYEEISNTLNSLVKPVQYNEDNEETTLYKNYLKEKEELETKQKESENKCIEHQKKCNEIINSIKLLDKSVIELNKIIKKSKEQAKIEIIDGIGSATTYKIIYYGEEYQVVNTKTNLFEYEEFIKSNGIYQEALFKARMSDLLSQQYLIDLIRGTMTSKDNYQTSKNNPALKINNIFISQDKNEVLEFIYKELKAGRPVILQVTQDRSKEGLRHLITVVGYASSVNNYKDLNPETILVLDNYDGNVEKLSKKGRKLFNQGGNGYKSIGASKDFLEKEIYMVK